jgi:hypothetical protein
MSLESLFVYNSKRTSAAEYRKTQSMWVILPALWNTKQGIITEYDQIVATRGRKLSICLRSYLG